MGDIGESLEDGAMEWCDFASQLTKQTQSPTHSHNHLHLPNHARTTHTHTDVFSQSRPSYQGC